MRLLLRRHEVGTDEWRYADEADDTATSRIVAWTELEKNGAAWRSWPGRLGVRLTPADRIEALVEYLPRLALIAIEFPNPSEGRGYTQARLLRGRYGFSGELRAIGAVKRDQLFFLSRCGFDAFELAAGEDPGAAAPAARRFSVAYQPRKSAL